MDATSVPSASVTPSWDVFPQQTLEPVDIAVLVLYFLFVLAVGLWVSTRLLNSSFVLCSAEKWGCSGWDWAAFHWAQRNKREGEFTAPSPLLSPGSALSVPGEGSPGPCQPRF